MSEAGISMRCVCAGVMSDCLTIIDYWPLLFLPGHIWSRVPLMGGLLCLSGPRMLCMCKVSDTFLI